MSKARMRHVVNRGQTVTDIIGVLPARLSGNKILQQLGHVKRLRPTGPGRNQTHILDQRTAILYARRFPELPRQLMHPGHCRLIAHDRGILLPICTGGRHLHKLQQIVLIVRSDAVPHRDRVHRFAGGVQLAARVENFAVRVQQEIILAHGM